MCRLFALAGEISPSETLRALKLTQELSRTGKVPENVTRGHTEGWGMAGYRDGAVMFEKKRKGVAHLDEIFLPAIEKLVAKNPEIVIAHVRKMTKGLVTSRNNHPFIHGPYALAHNGSVENTETIPLAGYFNDGVRGNTDTERIFAYLLQQVYASELRDTSWLRSCLQQTVTYIRTHHDYTGLNLIFSDGKTMWVLRDYNPQNYLVISMDLADYFSLFYEVKGNGSLVVCSEDIPEIAGAWKLIPNCHCLEFDLVTKSLKVLDWSCV